MLCNTVCMFPGIGQKSTLKSLKEGRDAKQVTHIHLAFLFKTFFITMVQRNRMQTENRSLSWWEKGKKKQRLKLELLRQLGADYFRGGTCKKLAMNIYKTKQNKKITSVP